MKYKKRIRLTENQKDEEQLVYQEDNREQLEADLKATLRALKSDERELNELKSAEILDSAAMIEVDSRIEGRKLAAEKIKSFIEELFD